MALRSKPPVVIKRYSNRRLYDTEDSKYITLDELAAKIRGGTDVRVMDASSGADLTQGTLTQVIIESRGAAGHLPVPLLLQLIRMGDDALAEFLGRTMSWSLQLYLRAKQGAQAISPYNPFAMLPFSATDALARLLARDAWNDPRNAAAAAQAGYAAGQAPWNERGAAYPGEVPPAPWTEEAGFEPDTVGQTPVPPAGPAPQPPPVQNEEVAALRREVEELKQSMKKRRK